MEEMMITTQREENVDLLGPPVDDCCPICFGNFTLACKANCGHWYCASCILHYWKYSAAAKPCKCPMCSRYITNLTPEKSLQGHQIEEVSKVLKDLQRYNRLFCRRHKWHFAANKATMCFEASLNFFYILLSKQKIYELPLLMMRAFRHMMDPDGPESYLSEVRLFAMTLSILYASTPFDFIPTGGMGIVRLFDYAAFAMVISLRLVGLYHRWRLNRRLAAAPQLLEEE